MTRIDRARYDAADFTFKLMVPTRFGDVDPLFHINNVATVALLQEGRAAFNTVADLWSKGRGTPFMAALHVEYANEMKYPDPAEVATAVLRIGRTSVTLAQRIRQNGVSAVYAEATLVLTKDSRPIPLSALLAERFSAYILADAAT